MERARPKSGGDMRLTVRGYFAAFREGQSRDVAYHLVADGRSTPLDDAQWADWDGEGRLLVATREGRLQIRALSRRGWTVVSEADPAALAPAPTPPPAEAYHW
jgi:hypothetical protein